MTLLNPYPDICYFHTDIVSEDIKKLHSLEILWSNQFKSDQRRLEYISGRRCAHLAMEQAGFFNIPILTNRDRSPNWPSSITGSITHSSSDAAALIVGTGHLVQGVGIDLENLKRSVNPNISSHVLNPEEQKHWFTQKSTSLQNLKIIFSIKECIFKCFYPKHKVYLGFMDAAILDLSENSFKAVLTRSPITGKLTEMEISGRLQITKDLIFSSMVWM